MYRYNTYDVYDHNGCYAVQTVGGYAHHFVFLRI